MAIFLLVSVPLAFAAPATISNINSVSSNPRLAASGNNVYAIWQAGIKGGILTAVSSNNGATWTMPFGLASSNSGDPHLAASGANVYATWSQLYLHQERVIMFSASHDNGASWRSVMDLSLATAKSYSSRLVASGNDVFVTWIESTPSGGDVMFVASRNAGISWSSPIDISHAAGLAKDEVIVTQQGAIYLAWEDNTTGISQIYISESLNEGGSFSSPRKPEQGWRNCGPADHRRDHRQQWEQCVRGLGR